MKKIDTSAFYDQDLNHWMRQEGNFITIGVTDFAQNFLGKVNLITDLPSINQTLKRYTIFATVESDKSTTEFILPLEGKVILLNEDLIKHPNWINEDCYGKGWILKIRSSCFPQKDFLDATAYLKALHPFFNKST